jgi:glycosyltransferase involved in cell wall biosynthesis
MISARTESAQIFPNQGNPLLSICIPTYNRAACLAILLENLAQNVSPKMEGVEIVIADNASTDETPALCRSFLGRLPLRIIRRPETIIAARNYIQLIQAEAVGTFCLILGDDDMIVSGGLDYLLEALAAYSDAHFFITNFANAPYSEIQNAVTNAKSQFIGEFKPAGLVRVSDVRRFESFHESISHAEFRCDRYCSFLSVIFRREVCLEEASRLDKVLSTSKLAEYRPEFWFTHYVMWLRTLQARSGYFLPKPVIVQGIGNQIHGWANGPNLIGVWTLTYPLLYREFLNRGGGASGQRARFRKWVVDYYWQGVFGSHKHRIRPFPHKGGWFCHSVQFLPMLAWHPIKFLYFLARLGAGIFRRYIKHPFQGKAAPVRS